MPPSARAEWRDDLRSGLPLQARREWDNCVDEELRCEYWPGVMRTSGSALRCARRRAYMVQLPDQAAAGGRASMRTTPGGSGKSSTARAGPGGPWWVRTAPLRRGCWPSTLTAISSGSRRSCRPCAAQSIRRGVCGPPGLSGGQGAGQCWPASAVGVQPGRTTPKGRSDAGTTLRLRTRPVP